jgi:carbonyl reductase 1
MEGFNPTVVRTTLACNYHGTLQATRALLPLLKPAPPNDSRIVNVASESGLLNKYAAPLRERFLHAASVADVTALMDDFTAAVERGKEKEEGWPSAAYAVSKAGTVGLTLQVAGELKRKEGGVGGEGREGVLVNACCPGWVVTDMTKGRGYKTPDQGAQTPVMLAIGDVGGKSGGFWKDEREISWEG